MYYVKDNGLGIPEAYHDGSSRRSTGCTPDVAQGEGIGLALVRRMVERHGGTIWLESTPGVGTTFFVALPAHVPEGGQLSIVTITGRTPVQRTGELSRCQQNRS